jgi:hypothetical protein
MPNKEKLQAQIRVLVEQLDEIELAERIEERKYLVGKCFKTKNSYSSPQNEADVWWLYGKYTHMDEHANLHAFIFQEDKDGKITIETERDVYHTMYDETTQEDYNLAWMKIQNKIAKM